MYRPLTRNSWTVDPRSDGLRNPVVAFDVGGVSESVVHQETGLLCPFRDIEAMSQCIQRLANNQEMRCLLADRHVRTQELFDVAPLAIQHLQLYSQLVEL